MSDHYHWFMMALWMGRRSCCYVSQTGGSLLWECGDADSDGYIAIIENEGEIPF